MSQRISGDFINTKDRHDSDSIIFKVKYSNTYMHAYIVTVVKKAMPKSA